MRAERGSGHLTSGWFDGYLARVGVLCMGEECLQFDSKNVSYRKTYKSYKK